MSTFIQRLNGITELIELAGKVGIRTIKTGPLAGHQVRWGRGLPENMPFGTIGTGRGTMQIRDPHTKATMTIERGKKKYAEGVEEKGWIGGKHAYIANIKIPKKYRVGGNEQLTGGKALSKMTTGVFDHFDRRGITASTVAGAYERKGVEERAADTHKLVQSYQKRGFKIDAKAPELDNEWNVSMVRAPGAERNKPISEATYHRRMEKNRRVNISRTAEAVKDSLKPLAAPAAVLAGTGAAVGGTAIAAHRQGEHQETAKKALRPAMVAGSLLAGAAARHVASHVGNITDAVGHAVSGADAARTTIGKRLSRTRGTGFIGRGMLHGLV